MWGTEVLSDLFLRTLNMVTAKCPYFPGMFFPYANGRGVFVGTLVSLALCHGLSIGGILAQTEQFAPLDAARVKICGASTPTETR